MCIVLRTVNAFFLPLSFLLSEMGFLAPSGLILTPPALPLEYWTCRCLPLCSRIGYYDYEDGKKTVLLCGYFTFFCSVGKRQNVNSFSLNLCQSGLKVVRWDWLFFIEK